MTVQFRAGQNAPLAAPSVRFTATASVPVDLCALVVDSGLRVASSQDVVFYNQKRTAGVRLDGDVIVVEPARLRPGADKVLCVLGADRVTTAETTLADTAGTPLATFRIEPVAGETALLCWEIYRRGNDWKIRALGQGYSGGLAELFTVHGVDVDDPEPAPPVQPPTKHETLPIESGVSCARMWQIFEDASRSAAAFDSAHEYAQRRLDEELSAAVADPSSRTGDGAEQARARAHRRCDELIAAARSRYDADSALLTAELGALDGSLPAALAAWNAPTWKQHTTESDGVRIGELTAPDRGPVRVPFCVPLPLDRPLWVNGDADDAAPVASALALRLLASRPGSLLDVVDPAGALRQLCELAAPVLAGPPVLDVSGVAAKLKGLAEAAELDSLAVSAGVDAHRREPRVLIVSGIPHGYGSDDLMHLVRIVQLASTQSISVVVTGMDDPHVDSPAYRILADAAQHIPADTGRFADPWTRTEWQFDADSGPSDPERIRAVVRSMERR